MKWFFRGMRHYADFRGRARRAEYWMFGLVLLVIVLACQVLDWWLFHAPLIPVTVPGPNGSLVSVGYGYITWLVWLVALLPCFALQVRRLHDNDHSGWWSLFALLPFAGWIVLLVFSVQEGQHHANRYGPDPKRVAQLA